MTLTSPGYDEVRADAKVLVGGRDDAPAGKDVRDVEWLRGVGGEDGRDGAVGAESRDAAVGVHVQLDVVDGGDSGDFEEVAGGGAEGDL